MNFVLRMMDGRVFTGPTDSPKLLKMKGMGYRVIGSITTSIIVLVSFASSDAGWHNSSTKLLRNLLSYWKFIIFAVLLCEFSKPDDRVSSFFF